jgi:hypothetical protein
VVIRDAGDLEAGVALEPDLTDGGRGVAGLEMSSQEPWRKTDGAQQHEGDEERDTDGDEC